jgi:ligand-binding SRPBCC domain-containing protein
MPEFTDRFRVNAPLEAVALFHSDTRVLKRLTPPPVFVQIHRVEPLAENSQSEFTLWFGPLPVRWLAVHTQVNPHAGFTDTQASGIMKRWVHRHSWQALADGSTQLTEEIRYEHHAGWRGLLSRLLFAPPLLKIMFGYRRWVIGRATRESGKRPSL